MIFELKPAQQKVIDRAARSGMNPEEVLDQAFAVIQEQYRHDDQWPHRPRHGKIHRRQGQGNKRRRSVEADGQSGERYGAGHSEESAGRRDLNDAIHGGGDSQANGDQTSDRQGRRPVSIEGCNFAAASRGRVYNATT